MNRNRSIRRGFALAALALAATFAPGQPWPGEWSTNPDVTWIQLVKDPWTLNGVTWFRCNVCSGSGTDPQMQYQTTTVPRGDPCVP